MCTFKFLKKLCLLQFSLFIFLSQLAMGQATDASFSGKILDEQSAPLPGATVLVRNESTGFQTATLTNVNGDFVLKQLPVGIYNVTVSFAGFHELKRTGYSLNQGQDIALNLQMSVAATELSDVVVTGQEVKEVRQQGAVTSVTSKQIRVLPLEGRNFTNLTNLSPLQGTNSLSLAGGRTTSTNITIDGVNARNQLTNGELGQGPYSISLEAIREFEIVTNSYDVAQGRQGGGAINAITKSGTNTITGSAFIYHRNDKLSNKNDIRGNARKQDFFNTQWGFSTGGPIIKDKLHYFVAFDRQDAGDPLFIGDINGPADEARLKIKKDTLDKALQIARDKYGVSQNQQIGQFARKTTANTIFARVDWQINSKNTLTLRNNFSNWDNPASTTDNSGINIREVHSDFASNVNSILASLRSQISPKFTNEIKLQFQNANRNYTPSSELPSENIPRAIVTVVSPFPTAANANATQSTTFQIGGQRFTPENNKDRTIHIVNTSYLNAGKFNFTFGTDNMLTTLTTLLSNEQNGRFFFNSLQDFNNMKPARYAREVPLKGLPVVKQTVLDLSLFAQADYNVTKDIKASLGLRYDVTTFLDAADQNDAVEKELGIRTDNKPSDWNNIQPRGQVTWDVNGKQKDIIKLGGGLFSSQPPYYAQVNNIQNSGTNVGAIDISGAQVPVPNFNEYRNNPSSVPGIPAGAAYVSTINSVSKDFQVPTTAKGNISYKHYFTDRFSMGINAMLSRTYNNYVYVERNLVDEPFFRIEEEDNRGVYVPANTITDKGNTNWLNSRKSKSIGRVLELNSDGFLNQAAVVLDANLKLGKDGYITASYTINSAKDNTSYNCCVANTSTFLPVKDDPRKLNYVYSDNHFDNKIVVSGTTPSWKGFSLGGTFSGVGGTRYSVKVANNTSINGDFVLTNDLAYIYDPNNPETPANIAAGMNTITNDPNTAQGYKDYLSSNYGKMAERNGGRNPFSGLLDLRVIKNLKFYKKHSLEISADLFNAANFLGKMFDNWDIGNKQWGETKLWGKDNNINTFNGTNLLRATGFDQNAQRYNYNVETGSGVKPINGTPYRFQLGARYSF